MIASASSLCVRFGAEEVFDDVTFNINRGERTALVGVNGAGKTTLFRLLAGELEPSEGELHIPEGTTVQCLQQQMSSFPQGPLQETVCRQAGRAAQALRRMEKVSRKLEHAEGDSEKKKLLKSLARAQDLADSTEAFSLKSRSERVLAGLGFSMDDFEKPLEDFSGGWRMRARLASLLLSDPDLLLLDEPTNHLDLDARIWLEEYLSSFGGGVWIISHDPGFLDRVVENVCELEFGKLTCYSGNYSFYSRAKQEEVRRREKMARHQAEQIEKIQRFIK
ncbi:MAG: ATP-binding cassette domain-containing protein, partial [Candidatus Aegiribacteria sp.]|nr:ATP-binding cassette domain-containing protein [Candidatus Aegiribacteria sp.]MBD3294039.1 ATP-binding cassette domain-containing protein [Candidatus Fermentibacteria bacterium]